MECFSKFHIQLPCSLPEECSGCFWFAFLNKLFSPRECDMSMFTFWVGVLILTTTKLYYDETEKLLLLNYNLLSKNASQISTHCRFEWKYIILFIIYHLIGFSFKRMSLRRSIKHCSWKMNWNIKIEFESQNLLSLEWNVRFRKDESASLPFIYLTLCVVVEGIKDPWRSYFPIAYSLYVFIIHHAQQIFNFQHPLYDSPPSDCYRIFHLYSYAHSSYIHSFAHSVGVKT